MLLLDGVYVLDSETEDAETFRRVRAPSLTELDALLEQFGYRAGRYLERTGLLMRDRPLINVERLALTPRGMCATGSGPRAETAPPTPSWRRSTSSPAWLS